MDPTLNAAVHDALAGLGADVRQVAPGEWGLTLDCAGWPLHVGVALRDGLLRAQAEVLGPGRVAPAALLHRNRLGVLVRFAQSAAGAVWIHGDLPPVAATEAEIDRLLGLLVEEATWARYAASPSSGAASFRA
jgi:hypothetical protein